MRVAVTEGPPSLMTGLRDALHRRGDDVVVLTRTPGPDDRAWDLDAGTIAGPGLADVDAVVNLHAESAAHRWTRELRAQLRRAPIASTLTLVAALDPAGRCQRFLSLSSTAFYGDRGEEETDEFTARGDGFLARAAADGEASARHAPVPTALLRTPGVVARRGGVLAARHGRLRGRLGRGRQYHPWIHLDDWVSATLHLLDSRHEGPVNMVGEPVTEAAFVAAWASASGRRPAPPVPGLVLRARYGAEVAEEVWLSSTRAVPAVLDDLGFVHRHRTIDSAMRAAASDD